VDFRPTSDSSLDHPSLYVNRELSLLEFHKRVLAHTRDPAVPLLERLRFLTISSWILDEFFEIRVGALRERIALGVRPTGPDGLPPQDVLARIRQTTLELVAEQYRVLAEELLPELESHGIVIYEADRLSARGRNWIQNYFRREVLPVLTPVGLDSAHPFPRVPNKSLNYMVLLDGEGAFGRHLWAGVVQVPRLLPPLIRLPNFASDARHGFILLTTIISQHVAEMFSAVDVQGAVPFRVTRNSNLWIDEEDAHDLLLAVEGKLTNRHFGRAVRLEIAELCPDTISKSLLEQFDLESDAVYRVKGPLNLTRLGSLCDLVSKPSLSYRPFVPSIPPEFREREIFDAIRSRDVLLHHPYESFAPIVELLRAAARDPAVLAIQMILYRTGADSPVGDALLEAARAGKEVTAVIELRARFDEVANIQLASHLQEAGARVVYGIVGFKAHAKLLLIVRREGDVLRRYVHLGTGNYNTRTALAYTDFGLLTANEEIADDVHEIFQQLTSLGKVSHLKRLVQTPFGLHERILELIRGEIEHRRRGETARIVAKVNSLIEPELIRALYRASQAGVPIDLIVRGTCCLRPGIPGISDNIRVRSIVGRFLEHHRVFYFHAGGEEVILCSSADWRSRNFFRRVEVSFPAPSEENQRRIFVEGLDAYLRDNVDAWEMRPDGSYDKFTPPADDRFCAQEFLLESLGNPQRGEPADAMPSAARPPIESA
jgi:polyphosphate kinase